MSTLIEVTCRDAEVAPAMRRTVLAHADVLDEFSDVIRVCHVILRKGPGSAADRSAWSVRMDVVLREGRTVAADLLDRKRPFETLDEAVATAFEELRGWLHDMAPMWRTAARLRRSLREREADEGESEFEAVDSSNVYLPTPEMHGTHHYVG